MKPEDCTLQEVIRITFINKMTVYHKERFVDARWICIWCKIRMYIGQPYKNVPEDLNAYFLSPQQYEEYCKALNYFKEGVF